ncbi:MAG: glycerol-3-phosphate acyltransferase [Candidatus Omnitrophica bacterium]|nr:glycerol-3-phosphate acyltransferase [Candidatus Omnitrophota bacterium]MCM8802642.1 glycerol-3-phosphate acyltransferase [Candidatus Omnitrophota bacterium]
MKVIFLIIFGYICGSISFAYLFTYFLTGKDIRTIGTGNPGAANVARSVGKKWGIIVWIADTIKGVFPISLAHSYGITNFILLTLIGSSAVLGHCYSIFLKFKGGKGAATTGGIILYLMPKLFPLVIILWFFAQKINPRSPKILITCILIYFIFLVFLYKPFFIQLSVSTLILILIGCIVNKDVFQEIKKKELKNGNLEKKDL